MPEAVDRIGYYSRAWRTNNSKCDKERRREAENWKFVSGVNNGQWPENALELLMQEGRPPTQFNFIQGKVLTLVGSFLQNPKETKFESEVGAPEWAADVMNKLLLYNRDSTDWAYAKAQFLLAMLTYRGILEIHKDYSRSPLGDLGLRYINPLSMSFDYRWKSSKLDDCKRVWTAQFMDAEDISTKYKKKSAEISEAHRRLRELVDDPNDNTEEIDKIADRSPEYYDAIGSQYLVIQCLEMKRENKDRLFDIRTQEFLPCMAPEVMKSILAMGDNSKFMHILPDETNILHVTTICPGLSKELMLEDGPHPLQIGGYPFIVASAMNLHGEAQGVVDVMKDPQVTINKRESTITHIQMATANGIEFVEEDAFSSPEEFERYKKFKNKPGETFSVAPDANKAEKIRARDRQSPPGDLVESVHRATGHMDRMWAPPAVQAGQGKSGESGKLFEEKKEQALVALEFMSKTIEFVDKQIGEKFFGSAKSVYSGAARKMKMPSGEILYLNWPGIDGSLLNDVSTIPRMAVRITQSQEGVSLKRERVNLYAQYGQVVTTPIMKAALELMMIDVIPELPKEDKEKLKMIQMEYIELLRARTAAEIGQLQQALAATQGGGGMVPPGSPGPSAPGTTPAEGGGISAEGKPIPPDAGHPVDVRTQNQLS